MLSQWKDCKSGILSNLPAENLQSFNWKSILSLRNSTVKHHRCSNLLNEKASKFLAFQVQKYTNFKSINWKSIVNLRNSIGIHKKFKPFK